MKPNTNKCRSVALSAMILANAVHASHACAGGGFSGSSLTASSASANDVSASAASARSDLTGQSARNFSSVSASGDAWFDTSTGSFQAGAVTSGATHGAVNSDDGHYVTSTTSKIETFKKGQNAIAKARTDVHTVVTIGGKTYLVVDEVARSLARATRLGSATAAGVESAGFILDGTGAVSSGSYSTPGVDTKTARR